ncbi:MAG TPA: 5-formyltetrahydrofolate cyclo-ligase [Chthoniobacteraceae bacterium]|jgi:5-formyltetrahydrofolate cyclo-ligase
MTTKADLRRSIRALLNFPAAERAEKSRALCGVVAACEVWQSARTVAIFAAQTVEPDVELLWTSARDQRICYPRLIDEGMEFRMVSDPAALVPGRWGLREPDPEQSPLIDLATIELLLVPGMAFTTAGARLGRGGGYYDRLLGNPRIAAATLGVCFDVQLVDFLPTEAHDRSVAHVVTESGLH